MSQSEQLKYPQPDGRDHLHKFLTTLVSPLPYAVDLITLIIKSPIEKRQQEFVQLLADKIIELLKKHEELTPENLSQNDSFVTTIIQACRMADTIHQEEKRQALCNAVLNSALPEAPDDTKQRMFVSWLAEFTTWHIKILKLFENLKFGLVTMNLANADWDLVITERGKFLEIIDTEYPEMAEEVDLHFQIVKSLYDKHLIANKFPRRGMMTRNEPSPKVTSLGKEFLKFITPPDEGK